MESKQNKNYIVGIYARLSKEDAKDEGNDSLSIENQKMMLTAYAEKQGWEIYDVYADDGISGTTFERPEWARLIKDIESRVINLVLVKDMSRFGRNYIQIGQYLDFIFPLYDVRFIALNDNIDTADRNSASMDLMPIMNVFNEWYAANTSKKIRAVFKAGAQSGRYYASHAPYGYVIGESENRLPVVDEDVADNVREIFRLRSQGVTPGQIALSFNERGILPPEYYRAQKFGYPIRKDGNGIRLWTRVAIKQILRNPTYLGNLVQLKTTSVSYKNKRRIRRDESEQVVIEGTHEAIIDKALWDKVREIERSVSTGKRNKQGYTHPLSGFMYCADCGAKMKLSWRSSHKSKKTPVPKIHFAYNCGNRERYGASYCSSHFIKAEEVEQILLEDIREKAKYVTLNTENVRSEYIKRKAEMTESARKTAEKQLRKNETRIAELERLIDVAYEDRVKGKMPEDLCVRFIEKYTAEQKDLQAESEVVRRTLTEREQVKTDVDDFIARIRKWLEIKELTREMCYELIERVIVGALPKEKGEARTIEIVYKIDINSVL